MHCLLIFYINYIKLESEIRITLSSDCSVRWPKQVIIQFKSYNTNAKTSDKMSNINHILVVVLELKSMLLLC